MGESLIYSWLRHEKCCQLAQTNWKASNYWEVDHWDKLSILVDKFQQFYEDKYQFSITKGGSVDQFLKQAEIDVLGITARKIALSSLIVAHLLLAHTQVF